MQAVGVEGDEGISGVYRLKGDNRRWSTRRSARGDYPLRVLMIKTLSIVRCV